MSFLSSGLIRYCSVSISNARCCRDILKSSSYPVSIKDQIDKLSLRGTCAAERHNINFKKCTLPFLTMWTQVRHRNDCPRFHRDIEFPNFDRYRKDEYKDVRKTTWGSGDDKPGIMYVVGYFGLLCGAYCLKSNVIRFVWYMGAAQDVLAMATFEVDVSSVAAGGCSVFKWRGKPLFVKNRTQADRDLEDNTPLSDLKDPETLEQRTVNPEWLILIGICTHLGCVPIPNSGNWGGGFYCPCHGSHYDNLGRIRKGPAPINMVIPPYKFISDTVVLVG